jgi:hypothetical protein
MIRHNSQRKRAQGVTKTTTAMIAATETDKTSSEFRSAVTIGSNAPADTTASGSERLMVIADSAICWS